MCPPSQDGVFEGGGLTQLLQQKTLVEKELWELKAQLEKAGFTSLSQMRSDDDTMMITWSQSSWASCLRSTFVTLNI